MKCETIFYLANKTSLCKKALETETEKLRVTSGACHFATEPKKLGEHLITALKSNNIVFVIGGLGSNYGKISAEKVFSKALGNNLPSEIYKLKNPISSHKGYVIRKDSQIIVLLPDEPTEISEIFRCGLSDYFKSAVNK